MQSGQRHRHLDALLPKVVGFLPETGNRNRYSTEDDNDRNHWVVLELADPFIGKMLFFFRGRGLLWMGHTFLWRLFYHTILKSALCATPNPARSAASCRKSVLW